MMVGTIMSNFWAALFSFTAYFLLKFQTTNPPFHILIGSFLFAIIGFVVMFLIRFLIGYILFTPEEILVEGDLEEVTNAYPQAEQTLGSKKDSVTEVKETPEEIAQVVKTMMNT